ncbi:MAG: aminoacyl--tRNA ligase-related protein, partial [Nitrososphaerota archaeon]
MSVIASAINKFTNFSSWFDELIFQARIVDSRFPVKGFIVYLENGMFILEMIRRRLEELLVETGHKTMMFPLVTTDELFAKEAEHIKGFLSEVFVIEKAGNKPLEKKLIIRPTSETIMYPMFKLWIRSHADLPFKVHQTVHVYRYETKATRPLYRAREFPWNEAHTAHATAADAEEQVREAIEIYSKVLKELGISYLLLKRPDFDKFAGAKYSIAFDAWNPDGRVNQVATVHNLGRNFSKVFEIEFEQKDGSRALVYQLCYGFGLSRVLAAVIAQHGDDRGCVFPPSIAPVQVVIVPIPFKGYEELITSYCKKIHERLKRIYRCVLDDREDVTPGEKFYHWEMLGVPVRVEIGPKEVSSSKVTLFRR